MESQIEEAIHNNNAELALQLVSAATSPIPYKINDRTNDTLLTMACEKGMDAVASGIIDNGGIPISIINKIGMSALTLAITSRLNTVALKLITLGAPISHIIPLGHNPLTLSIIFKLPDVALALIGAGAGLELEYKDDEGNTALNLAASHGLSTVVDELVRRGAHLDATNELGVTPLMSSICEGHSIIAKNLINFGASVMIEANDGTTSLMRAVIHGHTFNLINNILSHIPSHLSISGLLNATDRQGNTALMHAISHNMPTIALNLITGCGASAYESTNTSGETAFSLACSHDMPTIAHIIFDIIGSSSTYISLINKTNTQNQTPLMWACKHKNLDLAHQILEKAKAYDIDTINQIDTHGNTALHIAITNNLTSVALRILEFDHITIINHITQSGHSTLNLAINNDQPTVALRIIERSYHSQIDKINILKYKGEGEGEGEGEGKKTQEPIIKACIKGMGSVVLSLMERFHNDLILNQPRYEDGISLYEYILGYACAVGKELTAVGLKAIPYVGKNFVTHYLITIACKNNMDKVAIELVRHFELNRLSDEFLSYEYPRRPALHMACLNNMSEVADELIDLSDSVCINYISPTSTDGGSAILYACKNKMSEVALRLVDVCWDSSLGIVDLNGLNLIQIACANGLHSVALKIIERVPHLLNHVDLASIDGPIDDEVKYVVEWMKGINVEPLLFSMLHYFSEDVYLLLLDADKGLGSDRDLDINFSLEETGDTALICACREGWARLAISLVEKGAHINGKALLWAVCNENEEIVDFLLSRICGNDNEILLYADANGNTSLSFACMLGNSSIASKIVDRMISIF